MHPAYLAAALAGLAFAAYAADTVALRPGEKTEGVLKSPSDDGKAVRVKMPGGAVENTADIVVRNAASAVVEIDGRGATYSMPKPADGKAWGLAFDISAGLSVDSSMWRFDYNGAGKTVAPGTLSDFLVRVDNADAL